MYACPPSQAWWARPWFVPSHQAFRRDQPSQVLAVAIRFHPLPCLAPRPVELQVVARPQELPVLSAMPPAVPPNTHTPRLSKSSTALIGDLTSVDLDSAGSSTGMMHCPASAGVSHVAFYATLFACCACDQESTPTGWRDGDARMHAVQLKNPTRNKGEDRLTNQQKTKDNRAKQLGQGRRKKKTNFGTPAGGSLGENVAECGGDTWRNMVSKTPGHLRSPPKNHRGA